MSAYYRCDECDELADTKYPHACDPEKRAAMVAIEVDDLEERVAKLEEQVSLLMGMLNQ